MVRITDISFSYKEFDNYEELEPGDKELILHAKEIALQAYAPYSKFKVGAAIRLSSGHIEKGANVENAAFPSGVCAERNVLSHCISNYPDDHPRVIAIAAMTNDGFTENPVSPCGNCRQVIAEEESRIRNKIKIILYGSKKTYIIDSIGSLLPLQFGTNNMKINLP